VTTYIDPTTELPQNLGEIYSDRNIRIVGQARINPLNANQIDTLDIQVLCTPIGGGAEGVSNITNGTYTLSGAGSSLWAKITRAGTATVTPEIYAAGLQPKSRRDYVQVFYQSSATQIVCINSFVYYGPLYTRLGYGLGQRIYDAIVGNAGDDHATHTDLQTAVNDAPANGWILIKKMCLITTTITTASKPLKLVFKGYGTGLQASGATTGIIFSATGSQLVGLGTITGFTTYGVNLNNQTNCRIEMLFTGNTANINYGTLNGTQYNLEGSIGLAEDAHIQISTSHGTMGRWHNTTKRWEPVTGITVDDSGNMTTTQKITATVGFVGPGINPVGSLIAILNASPITGGGYTIPPSGTVDSNGLMYCNGVAIPAGNTLTGSAPNLTDGRYLRGSTVSGSTGGSNTFTPAGTNTASNVPALGLNFSGSSTSYTVSVPAHYHGIGTGAALSAAGQTLGSSAIALASGSAAGQSYTGGSGTMDANTTHSHTINGGIVGTNMGSGTWSGYSVVMIGGVRVLTIGEAGLTGTNAPNINHSHTINHTHAASGVTGTTDIAHTHAPSVVTGTIGLVTGGQNGNLAFSASGSNTPSGTITGTATAAAQTFAGTSANNEPQYLNVRYLIRVK